jgi:hypothetical protein
MLKRHLSCIGKRHDDKHLTGARAELIEFALEAPRSIVCLARQRFYVLASADMVILLSFTGCDSRQVAPLVTSHWMRERIRAAA